MHQTYSHLTPIDTLRADRFIDDLRHHDYDSFIQRLRLILARSAPAHSARRFTEWHFQSIFTAIFLLTGTETHVEFMTRGGRADCVLVTPWQIIIFEFKLNGDSDRALAQIQERDYATAVLFPGRRIVAIGISFSSASRNISSWTIATLATPIPTPRHKARRPNHRRRPTSRSTSSGRHLTHSPSFPSCLRHTRRSTAGARSFIAPCDAAARLRAWGQPHKPKELRSCDIVVITPFWPVGTPLRCRRRQKSIKNFASQASCIQAISKNSRNINKNNCQKIWWKRKEVLTLHSQNGKMTP